MDKFIQKYDKNIIGVLNGFDRLVLRGKLQALSYTAGMLSFLGYMGVLLKNFGAYAEQTSNRLKKACCEVAHRINRPVIYLNSPKISKEDTAKKIAQDDQINEGLICVIKALEINMSYEVRGDFKLKKIVLKPAPRKCLHFYFYWIDPLLGFIHVRIQTWFPFNIQIYVNGRRVPVKAVGSIRHCIRTI